MGYSKLDNDFWTSSIADAPPFARLLFMSLWALCDEKGEFRATPQFMARHSNLPVSDVEDSLRILTAPDPLSSSQEAQGRRVMEVGPNQWRVVNFERYRDKDHIDNRRRYWREIKRKRAEAALANQEPPVNNPPTVSTPVNKTVDEPEVSTKPKRTPKSRVDDFVAPTLAQVKRYFQDRAWPSHEAEAFFNHFENRSPEDAKWRLSGGKGARMGNWEMAASQWHSRQGEFGGSNGSSVGGYNPQATVARLTAAFAAEEEANDFIEAEVIE